MKKTFLLAAAFAAMTMAAQATIYSTNWNSGFANGGYIPDYAPENPMSWTDTRTVSTMPAGTFTGMAVTLQLNSAWTGDLYAYLVHDSGYVVLLDRLGGGAATGGSLNIRLANDGFGTYDGFTGGGDFVNIHSFAGGNTSLTTWNPDNSGITSGSGSLGSLLTSPNGTWTLFIQDLSAGDVTTVQSWGLQMDIVAVPEVESWIAAALAGAFGAFWLSRQIWAGVKRSDGKPSHTA